MENSLCFGKWHSSEARECLLCEVREECMIAMQDEKKMPCFKQYDPENYACKTSCHLGGDPNSSVCAAATLGSEVPSDNSTEVEQVVEKEETQEPAAEPVAVAAAEEAAAEPVAEEVAAEPVAEPVAEEAVAEPAPPEGAPPEAAPPAKPGKKKNKKDIIREALAESPGGIAADDIVTKMIEAGLSSEAESDKSRHYVIMSISHLRRAGKKIALREGKYVLEGDQDE